MRRFMAMAAFAAAGLAPPVAAQQVPAVEADLRCIAVLSLAAATQGEETRAQMVAAFMYFVGRIDGLAPNIDLKTELQRVMPTVTGQQLTDEGKRCGQILIEKGARLQELGRDMQVTK